MSIQIDRDKPLSKAARAYLEERGLTDRIAEHDERFANTKADEDTTPAVADDDYDKWKVDELKAAADEHKVEYPSNAKKDDLIAALRKYDAENPE